MYLINCIILHIEIDIVIINFNNLYMISKMNRKISKYNYLYYSDKNFRNS